MIGFAVACDRLLLDAVNLAGLEHLAELAFEQFATLFG